IARFVSLLASSARASRPGTRTLPRAAYIALSTRLAASSDQGRRDDTLPSIAASAGPAGGTRASARCGADQPAHDPQRGVLHDLTDRRPRPCRDGRVDDFLLDVLHHRGGARLGVDHEALLLLDLLVHLARDVARVERRDLDVDTLARQQVGADALG